MKNLSVPNKLTTSATGIMGLNIFCKKGTIFTDFSKKTLLNIYSVSINIMKYKIAVLIFEPLLAFKLLIILKIKK